MLLIARKSTTIVAQCKPFFKILDAFDDADGRLVHS